jgi:hypothetical protein
VLRRWARAAASCPASASRCADLRVDVVRASLDLPVQFQGFATPALAFGDGRKIEQDAVTLRMAAVEGALELLGGEGEVAGLRRKDCHGVHQVDVIGLAREQALEFGQRCRKVAGRHQAAGIGDGAVATLGMTSQIAAQQRQGILDGVHLHQQLRFQHHRGLPVGTQAQGFLGGAQCGRLIALRGQCLGAREMRRCQQKVGRGQSLDDFAHQGLVLHRCQCAVQPEQVLFQSFAFGAGQNASQFDLDFIHLVAAGSQNPCQHAACIFGGGFGFKPDARRGSGHVEVACRQSNLGGPAGDAGILRLSGCVQVGFGRHRQVSPAARNLAEQDQEQHVGREFLAGERERGGRCCRPVVRGCVGGGPRQRQGECHAGDERGELVLHNRIQ